MRKLIFFAFMVLTFESAFATDSDGNGIDDSNELPLAMKFLPSLQLDPRDQGVSPEPIEFVGANSIDGLWVRYYDRLGNFVFDKPLVEVNDSFDPPPSVIG